MAKYLIHAMPKRMWYVEQYLVPSMLEQGIAQSDISIYNDIKCEGNLKACMNAFLSVPNDDLGTWHLQDDVILCHDFKWRTEQYNKGIACGFSSAMYDGKGSVGNVPIGQMWFSFPCIYIPNQYAIGCANWVNKYVIGNFIYQKYWEKGVNDDWMFRQYVRTFHTSDRVDNIAPNLVDHIDWLIGGLGKRSEPCRAQYWTDNYLVEALEEKLK